MWSSMHSRNLQAIPRQAVLAKVSWGKVPTSQRDKFAYIYVPITTTATTATLSIHQRNTRNILHQKQNTFKPKSFWHQQHFTPKASIRVRLLLQEKNTAHCSPLTAYYSALITYTHGWLRTIYLLRAADYGTYYLYTTFYL